MLIKRTRDEKDFHAMWKFNRQTRQLFMRASANKTSEIHERDV